MQRLIGCAFEEHRQAQAEMDRLHDRLLRALREFDAAIEHAKRESTGHASVVSPGAAATFIRAQQAWVRYRDEHCQLEALAFHEGREAPLLEAACLADLTRTRTRQLRET